MDVSQILSSILDWIGNNKEVSAAIGVFVADRLVAWSPLKYNDLIVTVLKGLLKVFSRGKTLGLVLAVAMIGVLSACATTNTSTEVTYTWPDACYEEVATEADNGTVVMTTQLCEDAIIPKLVKDPKTTSLGLRLANTTAITTGLYSAQEAYLVIVAVEKFADTAKSYATLAAYILNKVAAENQKAGVAVFVTLVSEFADNQSPINACDLAILRLHLEKQKALAVSLGAVAL